jgi:hypothetical protein
LVLGGELRAARGCWNGRWDERDEGAVERELSSLAQDWSITPDAQTGAFIFKNVASGRCLDEPNANTSNDVQLQIYDCWSPPSQKFQVQTYFLN